MGIDDYQKKYSYSIWKKKDFVVVLNFESSMMGPIAGKFSTLPDF